MAVTGSSNTAGVLAGSWAPLGRHGEAAAASHRTWSRVSAVLESCLRRVHVSAHTAHRATRLGQADRTRGSASLSAATFSVTLTKSRSEEEVVHITQAEL